MIAAAGVYTVSIGSASVNSLTVTDPTASLVVGSTLIVAGNVANAGRLTLASGAVFRENALGYGTPAAPGGVSFTNSGTLVANNG